MIKTLQRDEVINENKNLVYGICSKYSNYFDKEDLYQVGMIGLIKAYDNYEYNKDTKFSTYAYFYVLGEVSKYVRENKNIKVSKDLIRLGRKIEEYIDKHYKVRGYIPSINDISNMLGIKEDKIISALDSYKMITKSLDEEINDDGKKMTLLDITASKQRVSNEQLFDLKEAFKTLNDDEKELLINRYYKDFTQKEIADMIGVNQVYVSRLEKKALCKMKNKMSA